MQSDMNFFSWKVSKWVLFLSMIIKNFCLLSLILFAGNRLALANILGNVVCPTIDEVKTGEFKHWLALNINSDEPASLEEIAKFKKLTRHFSGAQWSSDYLYGFGRCTYGANMEVYLASDQIPLLTRPIKEPWHWNGVVASCLGTIRDCVFS
ncbi:hypothetical protein BH10PSE19_BH10PSE19_21150 [soil metagenome]